MTTSLRLWALLAAAAVTAVVFGRGLGYPFVYDDHWTIVRNAALQDAPISRFFTDPDTAAAPETGMGRTIYRPLPTLSSALMVRAGVRSPAAWRAADLLLHALNGWLVFLLLIGVLRLSRDAAALGSVLFLVHPAQVETVLWITQRSNLMCAAGGLGALLLAARGSRWALAAYAAALFSKETAVCLLPFLSLGLWRSGAPDNQKKVLGTGLLLTTLFYLGVRHAVIGEWGQRAARMDNLGIGQVSWLEYLKLLFWPSHLTVSHWQYVDAPWEHPAAWAGLALTVLWIGAAAFLWRWKRGLAAGAMLWVPVLLAPHLGLLPLDTFAAERFLYLPLAGLAALAAMAWDGSSSRGLRAGLIFLAVVSVGASFKRTGDWRNETSLWEAAVRTEPDNPFARLALADAFYGTGRWADAAQSIRLGLTCRPPVPLAFAGLNNLSDLALREGRPGAALRFAEKALRVIPGHPAALKNRERALQKP